jgi:uncharacterized membrane protein
MAFRQKPLPQSSDREKVAPRNRQLTRDVQSRVFCNVVPLLGYLLFAAFLVQFAFVWAGLWLPFPFSDADWPVGLLLLLTVATVLAGLTRRLPGQNVLLASALILLMGGAAHCVGALTGIPFGRFDYTEHAGPRLSNSLPWSVPTIWLVAIMISRGVAQLILRPWRTTRAYGFGMMGATAFLVVLLDLGLEQFATKVNHYWIWQPTKFPLLWYGAPLMNFLGWGITALLILAFVTPTLINKKPVTFPPDYQPLVVWLLLSLLFVTGEATHHLWLAVAVSGLSSLAVAVLAIRGARS